MEPTERTPARHPSRREAIAVGVGVFVVAAAPFLRRRGARLVRRTVPVMGTIAELGGVHDDAVTAQAAIDAALAELRPGGLNPRRVCADDELAELADSIRAKGLVQPIIVRPDRRRGGFEIVAGERRWRAAQRASVHSVPVIVRAPAQYLCFDTT